MLAITDANGTTTSFAYDGNYNKISETEAKGNTTTYEYDSRDRLVRITDALGNVTGYSYDRNGNLTGISYPDGTSVSYSYDRSGRIVSTTARNGLVMRMSYDGNDNIIRITDDETRIYRFRYDYNNRLLEAVDPLGGVTAYAYDSVGNQIQVTDANSNRTGYSYDAVGRLEEMQDALGGTVSTGYDLMGRMLITTNQNDNATQFHYDVIGQMLAQVDAAGNITTVEYDSLGNVSKVIDALKGETVYDVDVLSRTVKMTDVLGDEYGDNYDVMGNVTSMTNARLKTTAYTYDLEGNMTSLTSPMGRVEEYAYDAGGRLSERVTPGGGRIFYDYNTLNSLADKSYSSADELGDDHPVQMGYNAMGQRISMEDITGESTYTYDSLGRLKTATNGSGKVVEYTYDEANNLSGILYPDGYSVLYEYDKNDNITKLTDRDGRDTAYEYDPLNRLTKVVRPDGSESTYTYNARNQVLEATNTCICGFLISNYRYTYDDAGLITKEVAKECLFASDKDYGHKGGAKDDCAHVPGNPWQNQNPEWETTTRTFTYDGNGQMTKCEESKGQFDKATYTYTYDEAGNRTLAKKAKLYSYLESWQNTYTYNDDNQMVAATVCEGNLTKKYTFTYDANGNLTHECFRNKAEVTYQYDTENRLVAVYDQQKLLVASTYDGDGNRAFQLNYNPGAECGYGMNVSGEVFMPEHSVEEDGSLTAEGKLFSYICSKTGRAYDLTEYVNDTNRQYTEALTAYTVNSGATESYSYAGGQRLSRNNIWDEAQGVHCNQTSYYLYDGRGSVTANTWYKGMVTDVYQYDPYGQVTLGSTEHTDFYGYNAESYNPNTGLEYLRARYYNAKQGRFFQEDTYLGEITNPLTLNRYAYVKNSPLNYVDSSGLTPTAIYDFFRNYAGEYKWTAKGDLYTVTINNKTLKCKGSGKNKHGMNIWFENGKLMAEDYDLAYYFRVDGWIEYMPGFEWMDEDNYLFRVDVHPYFLNLPFNRDFSKEVTLMKGTSSLYAGLTEKGIAAETFSHALFYYGTEYIKNLHPEIESINNSSGVIDIASNDYRIERFELIWDVMRFTKGYVFNYEVFSY